MTVAAEMIGSAEAMGWQVETDNTGQYVIYTDIPEGAPEVAQQYAAEHGFAMDSDNYGAVLLYTNMFEPDIRLCKVWVKYADGGEIAGHEVYLDIDSSVEDQIRRNFEPAGFDSPQIVDFKWDLVREGK